jgi:hypothetical protein
MMYENDAGRIPKNPARVTSMEGAREPGVRPRRTPPW